MNAKTRAAHGKWDFKLFIIITNVFVSITKAIALFVLIMVIITTNVVPLQVNEPNVKEIEKDLDENFGPVWRSHRKKEEKVMVGTSG